MFAEPLRLGAEEMRLLAAPPSKGVSIIREVCSVIPPASHVAALANPLFVSESRLRRAEEEYSNAALHRCSTIGGRRRSNQLALALPVLRSQVCRR
jgi:hypothetical protein